MGKFLLNVAKDASKVAIVAVTAVVTISAIATINKDK